MSTRIDKSEREWREQLTPDQYHVLREHGTEAPFSGQYVHTKADGTYCCAACGAELFSSQTKFESGTGWPSFTEPVNQENVTLREDRSFFMRRTEVLCRACGSHLGHVFDDGPGSTGQRWCINSVCLDLRPGKPAEG
jgi:peptide-methionine (R)-S-oxide reductase